MKKYLLTTALALGVGAYGLATPAAAQQTVPSDPPVPTSPIVIGIGDNILVPNPDVSDASVEVTGELNKDKDKQVFELVLKLKLGLVIVTGVFRGRTAAESLVVVEQENFRNTVDHFPGSDDIDGANVQLHANLGGPAIGSMNSNRGVTQLNFDVGNMVNQGNVLSASVSDTAVFADALAAAEQFTNFNISRTAEDGRGPFTPDNAQKSITVRDSVNLNRGVTQFNGNVGNMNNQLNAVSIAIGDDAGLALSESDLGQTITGNTVEEFATIRTTTVRNSMNNNRGVTTGNLATGNMNNQATVISLAGSASF